MRHRKIMSIFEARLPVVGFQSPAGLIHADILCSLGGLPQAEFDELYSPLCRAGSEVITRCVPEEILERVIYLHDCRRELDKALASLKEEFVKARQEILARHIAGGELGRAKES